jgi:peptidoglycan/xylan/chitin deacetylase (PgdA/CDA1 family)
MDRLIAHLVAISPLNALATGLFGHYVTIYMLHRPSPNLKIYNGTCPVLLEKCLAYAQKKQFQFASIDELVLMAMKGENPKRPTLCFTMDDGYLDQLTVLTPIFLKYNAKPTIFVLSDFSDNIDWPWDAKLIYLSQTTSVTSVDIKINDEILALDFSSQEQRIKSRRRMTGVAKHLADETQDAFLCMLEEKLAVTLPKTAPKEFAPADWESLRQYQKLGLSIGSHGKTHKVFTTLSNEKIRAELTISKDRLLTEIPEASNVFCYSSGTDEDYSVNHCPLVAEANFIAAVSAKPGNLTLSSIKQNLFNIKRHSFPSNLEKFIRYSSWIEYLRSKID